jgi:hypothetical protein
MCLTVFLKNLSLKINLQKQMPLNTKDTISAIIAKIDVAIAQLNLDDFNCKEIEIHLQVFPNGTYNVISGSPSYIQDYPDLSGY